MGHPDIGDLVAVLLCDLRQIFFLLWASVSHILKCESSLLLSSLSLPLSYFLSLHTFMKSLCVIPSLSPALHWMLRVRKTHKRLSP